MGVVYRATDSKLGRDVRTIKILPESFARHPERLARFEREARLLASLNHPNIAGIHGLEECGGVHYLILELVSGLTLAQRLAEKPLVSRGGAMHLPADCRGARGGARKVHSPPRPETSKCEDHASRPGEGVGFRIGEGARTALNRRYGFFAVSLL